LQFLGSSDDESTATISVSVVLSIIIVVLLIILVIALTWYCFKSKRKTEVQFSTNPEVHINPSQDQELHTVTAIHSFTVTLEDKEDAV